jgi:hypothetical protein
MDSTGSMFSFYVMAGALVLALLAFLFAPAVLIIFFARRNWQRLAHPWGYLAASFLILYGLDLLLAYLSFPIGIGIHGVHSGDPPPSFIERHALELRTYGAVAILIACSITFLRLLRFVWSK